MAGRWLLVEWGDGSRTVVNIRAVVGAGQEFQIGEKLTIANRGGGSKQGQLLAISEDRKHLELQTMKESQQQGGSNPEQPGPSLYEDLEPRDFSPSGSSWGPEECQNSSSDSENVEMDNKKIKLEALVKKQYTNKGNKKSLTPSLRADPIIPKHRPILPHVLNLKQTTHKSMKRKKESRQSMPVQQAMADSTRGQSCPRVRQYDQQCQTEVTTAINVSAEELAKVKQDLNHFKEMIKILKSTVSSLKCTVLPDILYETIYASASQHPPSIPPKPDENDAGLIEIEVDTRKEESTEPVQVLRESTQKPEIKKIRYGLIKHNPSRHKANKEDNVTKSDTTPKVYKSKKKRLANVSNTSGSANSAHGNDEMVPIGSGNTFVPKSVYQRINWDSYTMATRKLLMAVFPRKILASHSLTGRASPAFTNKPAKLCLDPKKVFDIIVTVTTKSNVKESLVRSAITTKCADENKMQRMRLDKNERKRKTLNATPLRILNNQVSLPPENADGRQSRHSYNHSI